MANINQELQRLAQIAELSRIVNELGAQSGIAQARTAASLAQIEYQGLMAQMAINEAVTQSNTEIDTANMATRGALLLASKALETSLLIAQFREKMLSLFTGLMETRTGNTWGRIKSITQGFKF